VANQSGTSYLGTPSLALAVGAGMDNAGNYDVLEFCPENYCCPVDSNGDLTGTSSNPNCQPGCNGGAQSICNSIGNSAAPYVGVCDFAMGMPLPDAGASTPDASSE
jgi:hypothetical protein